MKLINKYQGGTGDDGIIPSSSWLLAEGVTDDAGNNYFWQLDENGNVVYSSLKPEGYVEGDPMYQTRQTQTGTQQVLTGTLLVQTGVNRKKTGTTYNITQGELPDGEHDWKMTLAEKINRIRAARRLRNGTTTNEIFGKYSIHDLTHPDDELSQLLLSTDYSKQGGPGSTRGGANDANILLNPKYKATVSRGGLETHWDKNRHKKYKTVWVEGSCPECGDRGHFEKVWTGEYTGGLRTTKIDPVYTYTSRPSVEKTPIYTETPIYETQPVYETQPIYTTEYAQALPGSVEIVTDREVASPRPKPKPITTKQGTLRSTTTQAKPKQKLTKKTRTTTTEKYPDGTTRRVQLSETKE